MDSDHFPALYRASPLIRGLSRGLISDGKESGAIVQLITFVGKVPLVPAKPTSVRLLIKELVVLVHFHFFLNYNQNYHKTLVSLFKRMVPDSTPRRMLPACFK